MLLGCSRFCNTHSFFSWFSAWDFLGCRSHFTPKDFVRWNAKIHARWTRLPAGLQRLSYFPSGHTRKVFIYFSRLCTSSNWNSWVWCLHWADSCSQPFAAVFLSRKAQLLVRALTVHPSAHHDFENLSWSMIPTQSWSREKKQFSTSDRITAEDCSTTLLSSLGRVHFLVSAFLARFCHNKPVLVILLPYSCTIETSLLIKCICEMYRFP